MADFRDGYMANIDGLDWEWSELLAVYENLRRPIQREVDKVWASEYHFPHDLHRLHNALKKSGHGHLLVKKPKLMDDTEYNDIIAGQDIMDRL